jgi:hypothetical protein
MSRRLMFLTMLGELVTISGYWLVRRSRRVPRRAAGSCTTLTRRRVISSAAGDDRIRLDLAFAAVALVNEVLL